MCVGKRPVQFLLPTVMAVPLRCLTANVFSTSVLTDDEEDQLMRLIYVLLANNSNASVTLRWHQALTTKAGVGCIMRAIQS